MQPGLMPGLPPGTQLSLPDAVRLRDRATILARQLYAAPDGAGPAMADQQVRLLRWLVVAGLLAVAASSAAVVQT
jgi:hypothetical protein